MTLQNLSKILDKYDQKLGSSSLGRFELLKGLPFYNWQNPQDTRTLNHIIGLPQKNGQYYPLFDYEQLVFDTLQNHKQIWIKKATGLGITEFIVRYMAWLCFREEHSLSGNQMCIVTGPRIELAITLIDRMKDLFHSGKMLNHRTIFDTKETVIELNGVHIEAYPSHHLDAMRGLTNVTFIYLDEADFFPPGQQQDARDVSERYIAKSNPWIVMVSTPNSPDGLFDRIEREPKDTCLYKRLFLDYSYGLDKIYTRGEIEKAKASPSFEREYNLKYLGKVGNVFHTLDIEAAICTQQEGREMLDWSTSAMVGRSMGIDVAWGDTSKFAIVITQFRNRKVEVFYAESFEKPQMNYIINHIMQLKHRHHCTKIYVDGANPEVIRELKSRIGEYHDYYGRLTEEQIWGLRSSNSWQIIPVNFQKRHREMLQWTYTL
ncbi:MAG: DEAD/DEAH box helicase family protein, partial [Nitrososphaeraceae archaeon]